MSARSGSPPLLPPAACRTTRVGPPGCRSAVRTDPDPVRSSRGCHRPPDRDPAAGDILATNGPGPGQYGPLIYTPAGRLVWFDRLPAGEAAENLSEQTYEGHRDLT